MKGKRKNQVEPESMDDMRDNASQEPPEHAEAEDEASSGRAADAADAGETGVASEGEQLRAALAAMESRCLRLQADFTNYRNRMQREREDLWRRAHAELIEELLPALDHLDLAIDAASEHGAGEAFVEGFRLVRDQFYVCLGKFGLAGFDALGQEFDHNRHEAIAHTHSAEVGENRVMAQARKGYMLGDRLLRAAQVIVSRGAAEAGGEDLTEGEG